MKAKISFLKYAFIGLAIPAMLTACSVEDPDLTFDDTETIRVKDANLDFGSDNVWTSNQDDYMLTIDDYEFSHGLSGGIVYGFTPSKIADNKFYENGYEMPYAVMFDGKFNSTMSPYLVGYWASFIENDEFSSRTCRIYNEEKEPFMPVSVMVANNTYAYYAMKEGNAYASKFTANDYFNLVIHGVHEDGSEDEVVFPLASGGKILSSWTEVDLHPLGICTGIYFTMESSDSGEWGINTPTYFCINNLIVKE